MLVVFPTCTSEHPLPLHNNSLLEFPWETHIQTYFGKLDWEDVPDEPSWRSARPLPGSHLQQEGPGGSPVLLLRGPLQNSLERAPGTGLGLGSGLDVLTGRLLTSSALRNVKMHPWDRNLLV